MAATIGKIISRLPFCLQYMLCENSAPRTSTTPLNIQNIVQHHLTQLFLHTQQGINLFANILVNSLCIASSLVMLVAGCVTGDLGVQVLKCNRSDGYSQL
jgi:hypothetical protein